MAHNAGQPKQLVEVTSRALDAGRARLTETIDRYALRVFAVQKPTTIFIRGTRCHVTVRYHDLDQVEIHARLYNAFGLLFVAEQDEAGVYLIVRRRRLLGLISRAEFLLKVPRYANLTFNLTPGTIRLDEINGILELPPLLERIPNNVPQIPAEHYNKP